MAVILTQEEANELLKALKKCLQQLIIFPPKGKSDASEYVSKKNKNEKFIIHINNKSRRTGNISFVALYKKGYVKLLRLDIGDNLSHTNEKDLGGEKIIGTHLHLYKEGHETRYAIPFEITNPNLENIFYEFLDLFNVIEKPKVKYQESMKV